MTIAAGARLGPYEILSLLGSGGMGEVWRARDTRLGREVAIKVLPAELSVDRDRLRRFEREARAASALNHPNIVSIYDIGSADSVSYIAMERVEGNTLRELLSPGSLPTKRLLQISTQIAEGLAKAHESGIVHRDLKPENVMVTKDGHVKILDFGLAKLTEPEETFGERTNTPTISAATEPGIVMGTVGYMSPEQASGKAVDYRSDQFSFGSLLYEMATGKRAFVGRTKPEIFAAIIRDEPEPITASNAKIPPPLRWIVERCLAKEPRERYASTEDLARELRSLRDHLSEATLSSEVAPVRRRRLGPALALSTALATLVAGLLAGKFLWKTASSSPSFQRVTFRRGEVPAARFSPDGQTIVYSFSARGEPADVYSARVGTAEFRALGAPGSQLLAVSSSGEVALALDWRWGGPYVGTGTLAQMSLAGGAPRGLVDNAMFADWSSDGKNLAVIRFSSPGRRLEFPVGKVLYQTTDHSPIDPRVSPRGDSVAFLELDQPNGRFSVQIVDRAGKRRTLSDGWTFAQGLAWANGGNEIWFTATKSGSARTLHSMALSGRERLIARFPGALTLQDVSPQGRVLLTQENVRREMAGRLSGDAADKDLTWLDYSFPTDLSNDGKRLLFVEAGEGSGTKHSLWIKHVDEPFAVRLGDGTVGSSLSPDGKWVAAIRTLQNGTSQLQLVPTGAGEERPIPLGEASPHWTRWLTANQIVIDGRVAGQGARAYVVAVSGGAPRAVNPKGASCGCLSPDGRTLLCGRDGRMMLQPIAGGEPRLFPVKIDRGQPMGWAENDHTLFVGEDGVPARILRVDLETGKTTIWKELAPPDPAGVRTVQPIAITPDGKSYVYTYRRVLSDLYVVDGLK